MPVIKLSQQLIASGLHCTGKRRIEYCDKDLPGLYVEVRATSPGQGTYYLRYKDGNGKTCHQKLERTGDMELDEARARAKTLKAEITLGKDPRAEEKAKKAVPTLTEFMEDMYFPHVRTRKRTAAKDEEYYRLRLKAAFGNKRLNQIRRREVQLFHSALHAEGLAPATCNHYLKLLKRVFNLAIQWEVVDMKNPACGIQQYRELNLIENYMDDEQLQRLLTVLKRDKNRTVCDIILFLLSTGARLSEVLNMKHEMVNTERRVWRIPATNSKSGKVRPVPLNDTALEVLSKQNTKDEFEHVFINRQTGKPYTTIQKVWNRLRNKADLGHVRCHDLRHQYASMLVNSGRTLYEVQQILGHSTSKVTQRYSHLTTATLQNASATAAAQIKKQSA
jgi:integrase